MELAGPRESQAAFIVPLATFKPESLRHVTINANQLGVYARSDGDLNIEEWVTEPHPATGGPYVMAMHTSVVERLVLTRRLCGDLASFGALKDAMLGLGMADPDALMDHIASCTTDPEWNELYNYIPVEDWPVSRDVMFHEELTTAPSLFG